MGIRYVPTDAQLRVIKLIMAARDEAEKSLLPGREQSLILTKLDEASLWTATADPR
jgi:hypothetical protein